MGKHATGRFLGLVLISVQVGSLLGDNGRQDNSASQFVQLFSECNRSSPTFDSCMLRALNHARPFFRNGVPEFNIGSFDPFFAEEVVQRRGFTGLNYRLRLKNLYESGWTVSRVYKFKSDFTNGLVKYWQTFPEKYVRGEWEMDANVVAPYNNGGSFLISLYNYTQVTTVRLLGKDQTDPKVKYSVLIEALDSEDMKIEVKNLLRGRTVMEYVLDRIINLSWRPGFQMIKPILNDLVSTAFTKIFNDAFRDFPFDKVIPF